MDQGSGKVGLWLLIAVVVVGAAIVVALMSGDGKTDALSSVPSASSRPSAVSLRSAVTGAGAEESATVGGKKNAVAEDDDGAGKDESDEAAEQEEPQTEEEKREAEEERLVNDFDDLTDRWMEPSEKGVTMADIDNFAKQFRQVPKARQDECVHRALNLVPDENVMLLAGILMDKTMDKEIVETVYNDILNRDEDVKKPILQQIFKDKSHPCWADTAWILDVTDELPKKN